MEISIVAAAERVNSGAEPPSEFRAAGVGRAPMHTVLAGS